MPYVWMDGLLIFWLRGRRVGFWEDFKKMPGRESGLPAWLGRTPRSGFKKWAMGALIDCASERCGERWEGKNAAFVWAQPAGERVGEPRLMKKRNHPGDYS